MSLATWSIVAAVVVSVVAVNLPDTQSGSPTPKGNSANDLLGYSVALSGKFAIAGSPHESFQGSASGAVHWFRQLGSSWSWANTILPDDGQAQDQFGWSIDFDGKQAIIGAPGDDDEGSETGAAYVFTKQRDGSWVQNDKLFDPEPADDNNFGEAVAIHGEWALLGVPRWDNTLSDNPGGVYFFQRQPDSTWTWQQGFFQTGDNTNFGQSVAMSGRDAIAGAPGYGGADIGAVHFFRLTPQGQWSISSAVLAGDADDDDDFGASVDISGKYAIVGAPGRRVGDGCAYIFTRGPNNTWVQEDQIRPPEGMTTARFGLSVSINGTLAVVGAPRHDNDNGIDAGSVCVYRRGRDGDWSLVAGPLLADDGAAGDLLGASVVLDKKTLLIGAPLHTSAAGGIYFFR